jgi:tRNA-binding protein
MNNLIDIDDFLKVSMHTGTILSAKLNEKARKPAYVMEVDFGADIGTRQTSAQVTDCYSPDELPGMQVVAVTNFPPLRIAGIKSEVLVLGVVTEKGVVLLQPGKPVDNGLQIA